MAVTTVDAREATGPAGRGTPLVNERRDRWWVSPAITFVVFTAFVIYGLWTTFTPHDFVNVNSGNHVLSPFYSPCLTSKCGPHQAGVTWWLISWWPITPALLVLPFPLLFRGTCYYYRRAYYRSYWLSPPACAVPEPHKRYTGESRFPLLVQNVHRYSWYLVLPFPIILLWEAVKSLHYGAAGWGLGLGPLLLFINAFLLLGYVAGCHAGRHVCGGHLNAFSKGRARYWVWRQMTKFNQAHMQWAWISLVFIALVDVYIRLTAAGVFHDPRFF